MNTAQWTATALVVSAVATAPTLARADPARPSLNREAQASATRSILESTATRPAAVLDVPYVPQSEALCGGAAAAMVLRYWGARDVVAEDFAPLLDADGSGIRVDRLASGVRARGWQAVALTGTAELARDQINRRRPVIALVSVGRNRFHYIVIAAWGDAGVLAHDPARAPDRVYRLHEFEEAWAKARHWMLVITPPESARPGGPTPQPVESASPSSIADKILRGSAAEAVPLATEALRRDPSNSHAWYLLGAAEFLRHDTPAALAAWNHIGEPRLDLIRVEGLDQSSYASVAGAVGLAHGEVITADEFARARRRVMDLPAISSARIDVEPRGQGIAQIDIGIVERSTWPGSRSELAIAGARAAIDREVAETFANVNGSGDAWSASWRWWANRPRVAFSVAAPGLLGTHAVWRVEGSWEAQSYASDARVMREERTRAALSASDWISPRWKWRAASGLDRWTTRGSSVFAGAGLTRRSANDGFELDVNATGWLGSTQFAQTDAMASWTSSPAPRGWRYVLSAGSSIASAAAPLDLWQGAGAGHARVPLLRAHPLLDDGVITGPAFGRTIQHATASIERWPRTIGLWSLGVAGFVDAVTVQHRLVTSINPDEAARHGGRADVAATWFADVGAGLRLRAAWLPGIVRIDYAHGLRDGANAISAGWQTR